MTNGRVDATTHPSGYPAGFPWSSNAWPISATPPAVGQYDTVKEDYISRFFLLLDRWRAQTIFSSFIEEKVKNPAFQQIVEMGDVVVHLIINEIKVRPDFLYLALQSITGKNPVPHQDRENVHKSVDAWVQWANREKIDIP